MAGSTLKFKLGLYPKTESIEKKYNDLVTENNELREYAKSDELARYEYLNKFINSPEFAERKKYFENLIFKGSEEEKKELEYLRQKKSHEVKFYYKFKNSPAYTQFTSLDGSKEIADYEELKAFVASPEFKKVQDYMQDKKRFEKTPEFKRHQEFESMAANQSFKNYFKFVGKKEYNDFKNLFNSKEIKDFEALESRVNSSEFKAKQSSMKKSEFHATDDFQKLTEYNQKKKSTAIKNYYKLVKSELLSDYKKLHDSNELGYYKELETYAKSQEYAQKKKEIESLRFENTDEYRKQQEFKKQESSKRIKDYYKMKSSPQLAEYRKIESSKLIPDYEELEKNIQSDEFRNRKAYLLNKKKWEKSDEYKQQQEYLTLKKAPKIVWYFKMKDHAKFSEIRSWNLVFDDDFNTGKVDKNKWITRYFWGEVLLNDTYALPGEKHIFTDSKNFEYNGTTLKIVTRNEKATGKEWNPMLGFYPREFDYTSGIINSGSSFRTKYGKFEAKIKIDSNPGVVHAFWLSGETMVPQIDVFKCYNNKIFFSTYFGNPATEQGVQSDTVSFSSSVFKDKYFIYSLEWSPEKLIWKINNIELKTQTRNIPNEGMYISLNSGVVGEGQAGVPAKMEIDWVRCFQKY